MKFRIKYAQQVVGFFLLTSVVFLVGVLILMGINQRWFAKNYVFYTLFQTADGLTPGMSIRLRGFEIGKLSKIDLNSSNRVDVTLEIYDNYYEKVKPNSVIELASNPLGLGGGLNFYPGKNNLPPAEEYAFIPSTDTIIGRHFVTQILVDKPEGNEAINGIISQIEPLLSELRGTMSTVNSLLVNVNSAIEGKTSGNQVGSLLSQAQLSMSTINALLLAAQEQTGPIMANAVRITDNIAETTRNLRDPKGLIPKLLDSPGSISTFFNDNNVLFDKVTSIMTELVTTTQELNELMKYVNTSTPQITGILEDSKTAIKRTSDVLEGLSNNPFLKGGITERKPQSSPIETTRSEEF